MVLIPLKAGDRHPKTGKSADPAVGLRFQVKIGDEPIGWFAECSGLGVEYEVTEWPEGGENRFVHKFRGRAKHPNLVLKRGITHENALAKLPKFLPGEYLFELRLAHENDLQELLFVSFEIR